MQVKGERSGTTGMPPTIRLQRSQPDSTTFEQMGSACGCRSNSQQALEIRASNGLDASASIQRRRPAGTQHPRVWHMHVHVPAHKGLPSHYTRISSLPALSLYYTHATCNRVTPGSPLSLLARSAGLLLQAIRAQSGSFETAGLEQLLQRPTDLQRDRARIDVRSGCAVD